MIVGKDERIDSIGFKGLRIIQKPGDFCYGVDAVILADFAASISKRKKRIMDLGTGTGIIPLILSHKTEAEVIHGIEIQKDSYERGLRNIELNCLSDRLKFINCNVKDIESEYKGCYQCVTCNPPYMEAGAALINSVDAKCIARHEVCGSLEDFIKAAAFLMDERGELFMVHRPQRMADIMCLGRKYSLEPKTLRMVSPKEGEVPNIMLIHMIKNAGKELKMMKTLNVYNGDGTYTREIQHIYERL